MTFEEYLTKRRVNVAAFAAGEPQRFAEWQHWFGQMHPDSFYVMVKMVLNDVRRNYWLEEVPKPVAAPASETAAAPARPAGRRAPLARPVTATSETAKTEIPTETFAKPAPEISKTKPAETGTSEETAAAKPARPVFKPRAVIKKPATTSAEETNPETSETEKAAEAKPATENAEAVPPKPARPRAVIKRPAALTNPEAKPAETPETPTSENAETIGNPPQKVAAENAQEAQKPVRQRPVFKRPAASPSTEKPTEESEKTIGETPQKPEAALPTDNPVALPGQEGASETKAVADEIQQSPEAAKAAEEVAAAAGHMPKPPRPRPVFKRLMSTSIPPETTAPEPEKTVSGTAEKSEVAPLEMIPEKPKGMPENSDEKPESKTIGNPDEKAEEATPKPPRPRPIFKRPTKPAGDNESPE